MCGAFCITDFSFSQHTSSRHSNSCASSATAVFITTHHHPGITHLLSDHDVSTPIYLSHLHTELNMIIRQQHFCLLILLFVIYGVYSAITLWPQAKSPPENRTVERLNANEKSELCGLNVRDLASVVWSHRGTFAGSVDGSDSAVAQLLDGGIFNFDVDVSLWGKVASNATSFIVAHPSAITSQSDISQFQTVSALLAQVYEATKGYVSPSASRHVTPFITLEPKFQDTQELLRLLELVSNTKLGRIGHVAIITRNSQELDIVKSYYRVKYAHATSPAYDSAVAVAYRSRRTHPDDFLWNLCEEQTSQKKSLPRFCNLQAISVPLLRQINMPDIKLVTSSAKVGCDGVQQSPSQRTLERSYETSGDPVVAWVIDTEEEMWRALDMGADAVISNHPIKLKTALYERYANKCGLLL
jgi:glycerophosphoryl diester phosphodiesterase